MYLFGQVNLEDFPPFFHRGNNVFIWQKNGWATFSKPHLATLLEGNSTKVTPQRLVVVVGIQTARVM
jgi:hypothetical protein